MIYEGWTIAVQHLLSGRLVGAGDLTDLFRSALLRFLSILWSDLVRIDDFLRVY
jgi:hypothetical protein